MHESHIECVKCGCVWLPMKNLFRAEHRCPECGHWNRRRRRVPMRFYPTNDLDENDRRFAEGQTTEKTDE